MADRDEHDDVASTHGAVAIETRQREVRRSTLRTVRRQLMERTRRIVLLDRHELEALQLRAASTSHTST